MLGFNLIESEDFSKINFLTGDSRPVEIDKNDDTLLLILSEDKPIGFFILGLIDGDVKHNFAHFFLLPHGRRHSTFVMREIVKYFFCRLWLKNPVWHCTVDKEAKDVRHFVNRIGFNLSFVHGTERYYKVDFRSLYVHLVRG